MRPPTSEAPSQPAKALTVRGATVLGIGSMVGAGIFALLGEAGAVAGAATWISFLLGGIVAGLLGYVCVKLGTRFPSRGGIVTYLIEGFGRGRLVGTTAWLGYGAAVVVVTAMVAVSFGGYAVSLFGGDDPSPALDNVFITALILVMVAINLVGASFVARAQALLVTGVLCVFVIFIVVTITDLDPDHLAASEYPSVGKIISGVALTFFAYLGFNVITFTAGDLPRPERDLPRAMFGAIGTTAVVYVFIAIGVFGVLTVPQVIEYGETAIAEAARPSLGDAGFTIMSVVALLSTAGCTNATLYAANNLTGMLAEEGLFPRWFGPESRLGRNAGLLITAAFVLILANAADLGAIASVGSAVSLMVFLIVGLAGWRRRKDTGSNPWLVAASIAMSTVVLAVFAVDTVRNEPWTFVAILAFGVVSFGLDALTRRHRAEAATSGPR
jgi:amino acid transporter